MGQTTENKRTNDVFMGFSFLGWCSLLVSLLVLRVSVHCLMCIPFIHTHSHTHLHPSLFGTFIRLCVCVHVCERMFAAYVRAFVLLWSPVFQYQQLHFETHYDFDS